MEDGAAGQLAAKQVVKKKRPPKKTVEQNLSNINSSESERKCEVRDGFLLQDWPKLKDQAMPVFIVYSVGNLRDW